MGFTCLPLKTVFLLVVLAVGLGMLLMALGSIGLVLVGLLEVVLDLGFIH